MSVSQDPLPSPFSILFLLGPMQHFHILLYTIPLLPSRPTTNSQIYIISHMTSPTNTVGGVHSTAPSRPTFQQLEPTSKQTKKAKQRAKDDESDPSPVVRQTTLQIHPIKRQAMTSRGVVGWAHRARLMLLRPGQNL